MTLYFDHDRRRAQQITIIVSLVLAICAVALPDRLMVHHGAIILVVLLMLFGWRIARNATAVLSVAIVAVLLLSGLVRSSNSSLGDLLYYSGVGLAGCLVTFYIILYIRNKQPKHA